MAHCLAPQAEQDLDAIWLYIARQSGNQETATRTLDSIFGRFLFLTAFPYAGRSRERELGAGVRSFPVGEYVILYCLEEADVLILRVVHGKRDLEGLWEA